MEIEDLKLGDIFSLGEHRLAYGSSLDKELLEKLIRQDKIDLILVDPPYGVSMTQSKAGFKQDLSCPIDIINDDISDENKYEEFSVEWIRAIIPYLNNKNSIYIFNSDKMIFALKRAMEKCTLKFSQMLIWIKSQPVIGRLDYLPQHELIAYGWHGTHLFRKLKDKSVLFYPKPNKSILHPTMKPVALLRNLVINSTKINGVVFDGFAGAGSTLIACEHTKRKCLLVEIEPIHCLTIIKRWEKLTGKNAVKL